MLFLFATTSGALFPLSERKPGNHRPSLTHSMLEAERIALTTGQSVRYLGACHAKHLGALLLAAPKTPAAFRKTRDALAA